MRKLNKIIITGATGSIGISLIKLFVRENIFVKVLLNKNSKRNNNVLDLINENNKSLISVDYVEISEYKNVNPLNEQYDAFLHLAWLGTVGKDRIDEKLQNDNFIYSLNAIELAKKYNCNIFVGFGSQAEYGISNEKLNSKTNTNPLTMYGKYKLKTCIEGYNLAKKLNIDFLWLRILSVFGEYDKAGIVKDSILNMMNNNEMKFTKAEQIFDFLYSYDAANIIYNIILNYKNTDNYIYCIGSGIEKKLKDSILDIKNVVNKNYDIKFGELEYGKTQPMYLVCDTNEVENLIGKQNLTDFKTAIKNISEYYRSNQDGE